MGALLSIVTVAFMGAFFSFAHRVYGDNLPIVHFADKPATLPVKKRDGSDAIEHLSIKELLETRCASLFTGFRPLWWLFK